ncbi:MAG TPA: hypothetical protein PK628_10655, partial [Chitinophagales bacterium]|nr:hypothetical protein [Chitinophagales bacterium]
MKRGLFFLFFGFLFFCVQAQDDIVLDLDSIKNIKTTRYSSINEVGVGIHVAGKLIQKFPDITKKTTL